MLYYILCEELQWV